MFLDGLHQFEYLLRDFINTEAVCHRDSVIMLDDCLQNSAEMNERIHHPDSRSHKETAHWWTGDVWKVVKILEKYRPDLHLTIADPQPTGNIGITNLDPPTKALRERYYDIVREFMALPPDEEALAQFYEGITLLKSWVVRGVAVHRPVAATECHEACRIKR